MSQKLVIFAEQINVLQRSYMTQKPENPQNLKIHLVGETELDNCKKKTPNSQKQSNENIKKLKGEIIEKVMLPQDKISILMKEKISARIREKVKENISNKPKPPIEQLIDYFSVEKHEKFLPSKKLFHAGILSPYERLSQNAFNGTKTRLSVRKLLWFSYCELERIYALYIGDKFADTIQQVNHGVVLHKNLEREAHPPRKICLEFNGRKVYVNTDKEYKHQNQDEIFQSEVVQEKLESTEEELKEESLLGETLEDTTKTVGARTYPTIKGSINPQNTQAFKLLQTIGRLVNLFQKGSCREILIHAYYSPEKESFVNEDFHSCIAINGMIDELLLDSSKPEELSSFKQIINCVIHEEATYDDVIHAISSYSHSQKNSIKLITKEYKSRKRAKAPARNFVRIHFLQVGIYYSILKGGALEANACYRSWVNESAGRRIPTHEPLENEIIALCCMTNRMFFQECLKMKYGKEMDFADVSYHPPQHPYEFKNTTNRRFLDELNGTWVYTPTFAHIIARLGQIQHLLYPFIGDEVEVEYLTLNRETVAKIRCQYDFAFVHKGVKNGMKLWLGERDPNVTTNISLCIDCDFKDKCKVGFQRNNKNDSKWTSWGRNKMKVN